MGDYQVGLNSFGEGLSTETRTIEGSLGRLAWYNAAPTLHFQSKEERINGAALIGEQLTVTVHEEKVCSSCGECDLTGTSRNICRECAGVPPFAGCVMNPGTKCSYQNCPYPEYQRDSCAHTFVIYMVAKDTVKVGITREDRRVTRWAEQGASHALVVGEAPNRKAAGLIEEALGEVFPTKSSSSWYTPLNNPRERLATAAKDGVDSIPEDPRLRACYSAANHTIETLQDRVLSVPSLVQDGAVNHDHAADRPEIGVGQQFSGTVLGIRGSVILTDSFAFNTKKLQGHRTTIETTSDIALRPDN